MAIRQKHYWEVIDKEAVKRNGLLPLILQTFYGRQPEEKAH